LPRILLTFATKTRNFEDWSTQDTDGHWKASSSDEYAFAWIAALIVITAMDTVIKTVPKRRMFLIDETRARLPPQRSPRQSLRETEVDHSNREVKKSMLSRK